MALLLSIEDDPNISLALGEVAAELGMSFLTTADGHEGLALASEQNPDLVILDLGLPGIGGMEICRRLHAAKPHLSIIIVTSRDDELSRVLGLELGADDYVTKPFDLDELVARIRAVGRRRHGVPTSAQSPDPTQLIVGDVSVSLDKRTVHRAGAPMSLSRTEFDLLAYLMSNTNRVVPRDELLQFIWGASSAELDDSLTTHLSRLRHKLGTNDDGGARIKAVRGFGYRLVIGE